MTLAIDNPISKAEWALVNATTPQQTKEVEAMAAAAKAWAKEQDDYELTVSAALVYIMARCKTTELIEPTIRQGQYGRETDDTVRFLKDYGFTHKQWSRRKKELRAAEKLNSYQDDCIVKGVIPTPYGLVGFASNQHVSDDSYEWNTPKEYIDAARQVMGGIDLDPATNEVAQKLIQAKEFYTEEDDGLSQPWFGRVWLNPPYNMPYVEQFVDHAVYEYENGSINQAIVLTNNSTDTGWFHRLIEYPVCFTRGRIQFWYENGQHLATRQGQALTYLGNDIEKFVEVFSKFGAVVLKA